MALLECFLLPHLRHISAITKIYVLLQLIANWWILWIMHKYAAAATVCTDFSVNPSRIQVIVGRVLKFAGYIHHYKILPGNIFGLMLKN